MELENDNLPVEQHKQKTEEITQEHVSVSLIILHIRVCVCTCTFRHVALLHTLYPFMCLNSWSTVVVRAVFREGAGGHLLPSLPALNQFLNEGLHTIVHVH